MQYAVAFLVAAVGVNALPQAVTSNIAPSAAAPSGCQTDYSGSFGIAVMNITAGGGAAVTQVSDGQPQAASTSAGAPVSQISDGQPQAASTAAAAPVSQISDGQPQAASTPAAAPVSQISDGQPQAATTMVTSIAQPISQISDGQPQAATSTLPAVTQISDGQVQATTMMAVSQISDGQIQATQTIGAVSQISDGQPQATAGAVSQISDGQPQASAVATGAAASQISDGQPQASAAAAASGSSGSSGTSMVACSSDDTLTITLEDGILKDSQGRIGYIASNRQFQFDGPPQAGAIFTSGFSVCGNGSLALGGETTFYQCLSGSFYNLYDQSQGAQCNPVTINALQLVSCS